MPKEPIVEPDAEISRLQKELKDARQSILILQTMLKRVEDRARQLEYDALLAQVKQQEA